MPTGVARPLRINREQVQGNFYVPLATEGTLIAGYSPGMRLLNQCGSVTMTVVDDHMRREPVLIFEDASAARECGHWIDQHEEEIGAVAEARIRSGKLTDIG